MELGVDLGTSSTVAFLRRGGGPPEPVLFDGAPLLPSAVYADDSGTLLVGRDAVYAARARPERFEGNPKRRIDDGIVLLGAEVSVEALLGALLRRVVTEAQRIGGTAVTGATVCHPAAWGPGRRATLLRAAAGAGLDGPVRLVPEPVAAAAFHLRRHAPGPADLLVYDLGAGTFDVAVVRHAPPAIGGSGGGRMEVLCSAGLDETGGQDVDAAIVDLLRRRSGAPELWARLDNPVTVADRAARRQLWDDVRNAKEMLSRTSSALLYLPLLDTDQIVTREELEALAAPLIQRTVTAVAATLAECPVPLRPLGAVILVGGASRMPLVATMLHRALGIAPTIIDQPELVVAAGCIDPMVTGLAPAAPPPAGQRPIGWTGPVPISGGGDTSGAVPFSPAAQHSPPVPQFPPAANAAPWPAPQQPALQPAGPAQQFPPAANAAPWPAPQHPASQPAGPVPQFPPAAVPAGGERRTVARAATTGAAAGRARAAVPARGERRAAAGVQQPAGAVPPPAWHPVQQPPAQQPPAQQPPAQQPPAQQAPAQQAPAQHPWGHPPQAPPGWRPGPPPQQWQPPPPPQQPQPWQQPVQWQRPGGQAVWVPPPDEDRTALINVELLELATPRLQGVTLRGELRGGYDVVEHVFPADADGRLLVFADTTALARYAAADGSDRLIATPPWQVRTDGADELRFDLELLVEHLSGPPQRWLPSFVCRCRDLCAQLAVYLELDGVEDLLGEHSTIDQVDDVLRRHLGDATAGRAAQRRLARIDQAQLVEDWTDLIAAIEAGTVTVA
ncbi:Hsp70 family protein [Dactylosporangium sp. NBC_01737]|uniref:Hsp70 family protein n=1 Tax=Dactylosporangium sp. NBC_01737 TaxID=2975959 RepID=UPI002E0E23D3|nr:Hsp70 family protein [Dactylosporangium sp. NBC_01737]